MKGLNRTFMRMIIALALGVIFVVFPDKVSDYLVMVVGVAFMAPALIGLISYFASKNPPKRWPIEGVGSFLFGLWLFIMPDFFANMLILVLGFILALAGVRQMAGLMAARRWSTVPWGFFVVPALILMAGLVALFNPGGVQRTAFIIIGIASLVYGVSELITWYKFLRLRPTETSSFATGSSTTTSSSEKKNVLADDDIEDAEIIEEVKD